MNDDADAEYDQDAEDDAGAEAAKAGYHWMTDMRCATSCIWLGHLAGWKCAASYDGIASLHHIDCFQPSLADPYGYQVESGLWLANSVIRAIKHKCPGKSHE
jgi:hypothetical protein